MYVRCTVKTWGQANDRLGGREGETGKKVVNNKVAWWLAFHFGNSARGEEIIMEHIFMDAWLVCWPVAMGLLCPSSSPWRTNRHSKWYYSSAIFVSQTLHFISCASYLACVILLHIIFISCQSSPFSCSCWSSYFHSHTSKPHNIGVIIVCVSSCRPLHPQTKKKLTYCIIICDLK